jgi:hypothetical protein
VLRHVQFRPLANDIVDTIKRAAPIQFQDGLIPHVQKQRARQARYKLAIVSCSILDDWGRYVIIPCLVVGRQLNIAKAMCARLADDRLTIGAAIEQHVTFR